MSIRACLDELRADRVVAFPTDTFFALSCDPFSDRALNLLRKYKELGPDRPLPLLIPHGFDGTRIGCTLGRRAQTLAASFWPGKLTLVVPCHGALGQRVGRRPDNALGLRVPGGAWLGELLAEFDGPVVGTSANRTGQVPSIHAEEVRRYFAADEVSVFGEVAPGGDPSTVVVLTGERPVIEREGAIPGERVMQALETCEEP